MMRQLAVDLVVAGAGPAGLAAAHAAAANGMRIAVVDDNPLAGGQIWRGGPQYSGDARAMRLWQALERNPQVEFLARTKICAPLPGNLLLAETPNGPLALRYRKLILATGARELLLPFPGWTLPGVTGAGGLQALCKGGTPVAGKRVLVAGSGPLLLACAATLKAAGAQIIAILEQAPLVRLGYFAASLIRTPDKLGQALGLRLKLLGIPYHVDSFVIAAEGDDHVQRSIYLRSGKRIAVDCDYLACGYGLLPNTELAAALGCTLAQRAIQIDAMQATSVSDIYCAGEGTGIGGVDLALIEGRIAGLAVAEKQAQARELFAQREHWRSFARRLAQAFALRTELGALCAADTIVCRCEDVSHGDLVQHADWRSAKLHTRCGMGPCQGRICGVATDLLYGWAPDSVRTPISPVRIATLAATVAQEEAIAINASSAARDIRSA